jgi:hypothetical protein
MPEGGIGDSGFPEELVEGARSHDASASEGPTIPQSVC